MRKKCRIFLPLNYDSKGKISKQLYKLRRYSLRENIRNQKNIEKFAKYVAIIHSQNIKQGHFKICNVKWVIEQAREIKDIRYKSDIIIALEVMSQIEVHRALPKEMKFLAWDIIHSDWQKDYQSGSVGSCAWDIACIINVANDPQFSEIFLTSYLKYGGEKPSMTALYAKLFYVKVLAAIKNEDFENIIEVARDVIKYTAFNTDVISYETLLRLNIIGY